MAKIVIGAGVDLEEFKKGYKEVLRGVSSLKNAQIAAREAAKIAGNEIGNSFETLNRQIDLTIKQNKILTSSLTQVRDNLKQAFTPIWESILPTLSSLASWLATVTYNIAQFTAALFGKSVKSSQTAAKGMDKLASATKGPKKNFY